MKNSKTEVFAGSIKLGDTTIQVGFDVPEGATGQEKDAAFLAALAKKTELNYLSMGTHETISRDIFRELLEASEISTDHPEGIRMPEPIVIRRDVLANHFLQRFPKGTQITRQFFEYDETRSKCFSWISLHFDFQAWEGRSLGEFLSNNGTRFVTDTKVLQINSTKYSQAGTRLIHLSFSELLNAIPDENLADTWFLPSGIRLKIHGCPVHKKDASNEKPLDILTESLKVISLSPVPMSVIPSKHPVLWLKFQKAHVPGTQLNDRMQNKVQRFMRKHQTEALTDGKNIYTLAGNMLAFCDPQAVSFK